MLTATGERAASLQSEINTLNNTIAGLRFNPTGATLREQGFPEDGSVSPGIPSLGQTGLTGDTTYRGDFRQELSFPFSMGHFRFLPYLVGRYTGERLDRLPARIVAWADFARSSPGKARIHDRPLLAARLPLPQPLPLICRGRAPCLREATCLSSAPVRRKFRVGAWFFP